MIAVPGWTERLAAEVGWTRPRGAVDWGRVESALGTPLPASYKSYAEMFGRGEFGDFLEVFAASAEPACGSIVGECRSRDEWAAVDGEFGSLYAPFELFPRPGGLLIWGATERGGSLFWETAGDDPDGWPIVAVTEDGRQFSFRMEVSEFILNSISCGKVAPFRARAGAGGFSPMDSYA